MRKYKFSGLDKDELETIRAALEQTVDMTPFATHHRLIDEITAELNARFVIAAAEQIKAEGSSRASS